MADTLQPPAAAVAGGGSGGGALMEEVDVEEVEALVKAALSAALADAAWDSERAPALTAGILEAVLKALAALGRPFKYAVTAVLQQRVGAGLHVAAGARWDRRTDGSVRVPWESATVQGVVTVYALALGAAGVAPAQG
jgi:dynein light chain Tctex-type 1